MTDRSVVVVHKWKSDLSIPGTLKLSGSSTSLSKMVESRGRSSSMQSVDSVSQSHVYGSESDLAARNVFDQVKWILLSLKGSLWK